MRMRFALLALFIAVAVSLSLMIWLASDIPFWGAAAIAVVALVVNSLIAVVEESEPGGFANPDGEAASSGALRLLFRVLGVLVGVAFIVFAAIAIADPVDAASWWRTYVAPAGIIAAGAAFTYYGLTGRSSIFSTRNKAAH